MLAAPFRREVHFGNMLTSRMQSRVPRCLFGPPNSKDTVDLLQDALDMERSKFSSRWGIDPCSEDKENIQRKFDTTATTELRSPRKTRGSPYSRQTTIHGKLLFFNMLYIIFINVRNL
ncbi:hypothetical protein PV327_004430 [Microctonus hyperodae]|uniref:Cyclin-dependent kinase inhibitor domain-containing protein n=1 Tax=Microctonus hyperodae TaxID=165561 RepID=A0AA39FCG6_MICHY|nr:hypothetical protein PV327_004430 [Microctonus hyperodae]